MATDYSIKWVTAKAYTTVNQSDTINFMWKHLICHFGVPRELVADNGTQFQNNKLKELCDTYHIKLNFTSISYRKAMVKQEPQIKLF